MEDRAIQLYHYVFVKEEETDLQDVNAIIRTLLSYEGTQAEMSQPGSWMEMITESNDLWNFNQLINRKQNTKGGNAEAIHLLWKYRKTLYTTMGVGGVFFS